MLFSKTNRTALANKRLSQFVTFSGRIPDGAKTGAPDSVTPAAFFGRKKRRLSFKPG